MEPLTNNQEVDMKRARALLSVAALVMFLANVVAQVPPNFAGKWTRIGDPNSFSGLGPEVTIAQDAETLTVTRTGQASEIKTVYRLDGSDSKNVTPGRNTSIELVSNVKWDAGKLVITTKSNFNGNTRESSQTWSIDSARNLVIDQTHGEVLIGSPTVTKYKKKA